MEQTPTVICPKCHTQSEMADVLTAQSNQNVIFICPVCTYTMRNIRTKKG